MRAISLASMVALLGLGAWVLSLGVARRVATLEAQAWPAVRATITSWSVESHPARKGVRAWWAPVWSYRYVFDGRAYEGSSMASEASVRSPFPSAEAAQAAAMRRPVDSEVDVKVNPYSPGESVLDAASEADGKWLLLAGLGATLVLIALGGGVAMARAARQRARA